MIKNFDVVVIGAGPAGYIAAIRAAQHGLQVACIDEWQNRDGNYAFGGTCLNAGCIPSKALLESSELYHRATHEFKKHGITTGDVGMDIAAMNVIKLNKDSANPEVYRKRLEYWENRLGKAGAKSWGTLIDVTKIPEFVQDMKS